MEADAIRTSEELRWEGGRRVRVEGHSSRVRRRYSFGAGVICVYQQLRGRAAGEEYMEGGGGNLGNSIVPKYPHTIKTDTFLNNL